MEGVARKAGGFGMGKGKFEKPLNYKPRTEV